MMLLYNIILYPVFIFLLPLIILGVIFDKKWRVDLYQRFGIMKKQDRENLAGKKIIWFHAASVGEVQAMAPVVREMKNLKKGYEIVITSTSINGRKKIQKELAGEILYSCLLPLDLGIFMDGFIKKINPEIVIIVETEFWPNLISGLRAANIPLILMNGRISVKSFTLYRFFGFFFGPLLEKFSLLIMQSEKMVKRANAMGVKTAKTIILGNTKFSSDEGEARNRIIKLADKKGSKIVVAGSIREGEEEIITAAFMELKDFKCVLIIAPRRLNRVNIIAQMLKKYGLKHILWSELPDKNAIPEYDAVIVNTMGDLSYIYGIGDIAIIGGGFKKFGGHNPMEPAAAGLPIIMGKNMYNFEDTADRFVRGGGASRVESTAAAVAAAIKEILVNDGSAGYKGAKNKSIIEKFRASAAATAVIINEVMIESIKTEKFKDAR
jgi:3-deoxy-D-manno-octulosonic-acid transferase